MCGWSWGGDAPMHSNSLSSLLVVARTAPASEDRVQLGGVKRPCVLTVRIAREPAETSWSYAGPVVRIPLAPANSPSLARFLRPLSKTRQLPRCTRPGQAVRPAETRRARQHHSDIRA